MGLKSVFTGALSSILDEKTTVNLCDQGHGTRASPKNEPENQAMLPFPLNMEFWFHLATGSPNVLPWPWTSLLSRGCQGRWRHPAPHQPSWLMVFPAQLEKETSTNLKREAVLMKSTAGLGCSEWEGKFGLISHSLICWLAWPCLPLAFSPTRKDLAQEGRQHTWSEKGNEQRPNPKIFTYNPSSWPLDLCFEGHDKALS